MSDSTLVVTIGGQVQIVTFTLDWLLAQGESVREVFGLHLSPAGAPQPELLTRLAAEFNGDRYRGQSCRLRLVPIRRGNDRLPDIRDEADAEATWQTVYQLLTNLKDQGRRLHLCIAGGRRMMALLSMSAAMLLFGHQDRVWHIYTPPDFLEMAQDGTIMHARPEDGVHLIEVPVVPWGAYFPALRDLVQPPAQIIAGRTRWLDRTERARCRAVVDRLTPRQLEVLRAFAAGQTPQEVAESLVISLKTVDSHKTAILSECRLAWGLPDEAWLDFHFLRDRFGPFQDGLWSG